METISDAMIHRMVQTYCEKMGREIYQKPRIIIGRFVDAVQQTI
jgi:hypothetical protein